MIVCAFGVLSRDSVFCVYFPFDYELSDTPLVKLISDVDYKSDPWIWRRVKPSDFRTNDSF